MKMLNDFIRVFLSVLLLPCAAGAAEMNNFPFLKKLLPPGDAAEKEFGQFTVDPGIYRETDDAGSGLRLFDADGRERPFVLFDAVRSDPEEKTFVPVPSRVLEFKQEKDGSVQIVAELVVKDNEPAPVITRIAVSSAARDFDKRVKILEFRSGGVERPLAESAFFDYSGKIDLRCDSFELPRASRSQKFRIVIENYRENEESPYSRIVSGDVNTVEKRFVRREPKIDGIVFYRTEHPLKPVLTDYSVEGVAVSSGKKQTVVRFSAGRVPLCRLHVSSGTPNYSRACVLYGDGGRVVASGTLRKFTFGSRKSAPAETTLSFPCDRSKSYRLVIENGDDRALDAIRLSGKGRTELVRFPFPGEGAVVCAYGAASPPPSYDLAETLRNTRNPAVACFRLSEGSANPGFTEGAKKDYRKLYIALMIAAGLAALFLIWRNLGKIESMKE